MHYGISMSLCSCAEEDFVLKVTCLGVKLTMDRDVTVIIINLTGRRITRRQLCTACEGLSGFGQLNWEDPTELWATPQNSLFN